MVYPLKRLWKNFCKALFSYISWAFHKKKIGNFCEFLLQPLLDWSKNGLTVILNFGLETGFLHIK